MRLNANAILLTIILGISCTGKISQNCELPVPETDKSLPDLIITDISINPEHPKLGDSVYFKMWFTGGDGGSNRRIGYVTFNEKQ